VEPGVAGAVDLGPIDRGPVVRSAAHRDVARNARMPLAAHSPGERPISARPARDNAPPKT
jgi:hypothetical protein